MTKNRIRLVPLLVLSVVAGLASGACSSSSGSGSSGGSPALDPTQPHYGYTYGQWGVRWWQWVYQLPQPAGDGGMPDCVNPFTDATGAECGYGQSGDVFFLVGTQGGVAVRDACDVPLGKAIFFPILTFSDDNGGVPTSMQASNAALQQVVQGQMDGVPLSEMSAEFDGTAITDLGNYKTPVTEYSYTLPAEPNVYTCMGESGVTGTISPAYEAGFYVIIAPPAAGAHTLHFAGHSPNSNPDLKIDVTYHLTVK